MILYDQPLTDGLTKPFSILGDPSSYVLIVSNGSYRSYRKGRKILFQNSKLKQQLWMAPKNLTEWI